MDIGTAGMRCDVPAADGRTWTCLHGHSDFEGSGIGLAHCKKIATLHGGDIGCESRLSVGSTFWIQLPNVDGALAP